jgi:minor extracellular serine protease Vpr
LAALAALALSMGHAAGQDLQRADPLLRFLLAHQQLLTGEPAPVEPGPGVAPGAVGLPRRPLLDGAVDRSTPEPTVRTLVRIGSGGEAALRRHGARIGARAGDIVTARVPIGSLPALLQEQGIRAMEAAATLRPLGMTVVVGPAAPGPVAMADSAAADAGFDALRRRAGDGWEGLAGQGVIIGIYDSGLDLEHDDFRKPGGGTRVLFAWDQVAEGAGPGRVGDHQLDYGFECGVSVIDAGACPIMDRDGHGTHVAGTAAGDGSATGRGMPAYRFPGGAPAADLIVVKGGETEFTADRLVDGVAYIFERAAALGRPAVVNLSLSTQQGPHDGTTLIEQALDALSGPGRIIVSGPGMPATTATRSRPRRMAPSTPRAAPVVPPTVSESPPTTPTRAPPTTPPSWSSGTMAPTQVTISVRTPRGEVVSAATGDTAFVETAGGAVIILNAADGPSPTNGDHGALIAIVDADAGMPPDSGRWDIQVSPVSTGGSGQYHLWLLGSVFGGSVGALEGGTTNRYLVGIPASADRVIAAGAHVTKEGWKGVDDEYLYPHREQLGDIAYFSSPGPRRDGVQKPDLTAPGKVVISSLSRHATRWDVAWFHQLVEADSVHVGLLGTSMASPQVAAAVAVLLQIDPRLTPEAARDLLRLSASRDRFVPSSLPDPVWGAGKLDAANAVRRLRPEGLAGAAEPVTLSSNPIRTDGLVIGYAREPRSIAVYTLAAERVRSFAASEIGPVTTVWPLDTDAGGAVANGAYVLVVELPDQRVLRKLLVARP